MDVYVRSATERDIDSMVELLGQLFALESDFGIDPSRQRRGLELLLRQENAGVFVAKEAGGVIGMVTGQLVVSTAEGGHALLVEDLIVDQDCRGRGVGPALLRELGSWAHNRGAGRMHLLADETNEPALGFYRHHGWKRTRMICLRSYVHQPEASAAFASADDTISEHTVSGGMQGGRDEEGCA